MIWEAKIELRLRLGFLFLEIVFERRMIPGSAENTLKDRYRMISQFRGWMAARILDMSHRSLH